MEGNKIGIWGFGVVGKSAVSFFKSNNQIEVLDEKFSSEDTEYLTKQAITTFNSSNLINFLEQNNQIIPSPGINLNKYKAYEHKWKVETDIFQEYFQGKKIAITGTAGKTSVTTILQEIMKQNGINSMAGGNIGLGMLDLIKQPIDSAVLELSSFQLEYSKKFAPNIAIITNFFPNHLDRHETEENYFNAKLNILSHQTSNQIALVPAELVDKISPHTQAKIYSFAASKHYSPRTAGQFFIEDNFITMASEIETIKLIHVDKLPTNTFLQNWVTITAALHLQKMSVENCIAQTNFEKIELEHRLEKVATINGITFYNDSKSTTIDSTLAAVNKFKDAKVTLVLGGLSKGVNREILIEQIKNKVQNIYCFGGESDQLINFCIKQNANCLKFDTLEEIIKFSIENLSTDTILLFSPAGSSFDLFKNYIERGIRFKELVKKYEQKK
ncbi:MAG: UDP-N-acetylmuramoylalanine-D-glutamate ligase [candidate division TM6 bacterium GW2011_GWF2_32_72]|nr:MAG: UDP-N-acetylmuramoylalanine-D-glutamate ligase [candidate division TM6 bacterium GW2011_GWF2_32_72]